MKVPYNVIEVFTSEEARFEGRPVTDAVLDMLRQTRIAARCLVSRGQAGYYENGEVASARLEVLATNLPLKIEIILPGPELDVILPRVTEIVTDGIVVVEEMQVHSHRSRYRLIPRQLRVRDIMTAPAVTVDQDTSVAEVVRILIHADFNGLPVVDDRDRPVGIITQGDLVRRAGMPLRLGLLTEADDEIVNEFFENAADLSASEIMAAPVRTVEDDIPVNEAVHTMREHGFKRLPVVDSSGKLVGIVTRLDIFRAAVSGAKEDTSGAEECYVDWEGVRHVGDCMNRETGTVAPDTPIDEVLRTLDERSVQRIAVVDDQQHLLGLLTDRDILAAIDHRPEGLVRTIIDRLPLPGRSARGRSPVTLDTTAGEVMKTDLITVTEDATLEEALRLMVDHALKRLPVVDADGCYLGMVSRNALLRLGTSE